MARLVYAVLASLDGYVADEPGNFDWAAPGEEVHRFINELERPVGTYLYGRRLFEVMAVWQNMPNIGQEPDVIREFAAIWQSADKIVYSKTLTTVATPKTRLERAFDPQSVRTMVTNQERDVSIGGPTLAAHALRAGIVDDIHLFVVPVVVGGGTSCWPAGVRLALDLVEQTRFADGTLHLHYSA
ncbi:MAG: dihydrofolate reductase family protein [Actinobacteria bacterium]|nr:dihydrofolate reductase family protein [Actinomycetota bacterium]